MAGKCEPELDVVRLLDDPPDVDVDKNDMFRIRLVSGGVAFYFGATPEIVRLGMQRFTRVYASLDGLQAVPRKRKKK